MQTGALDWFLTAYRQRVSPDLLFVGVDVAGAGAPDEGEEGAENDVIMTGAVMLAWLSWSSRLS